MSTLTPELDAADRALTVDLAAQPPVPPAAGAELTAGTLPAAERPGRPAPGRDALRADLLALLDGPALLFPEAAG